jgi:hypothetical protein
MQTAVNMIGSTKTKKCLKVYYQADYTDYALAKKVTDKQLSSIKLVKIAPLENCNYNIRGFN